MRRLLESLTAAFRRVSAPPPARPRVSSGRGVAAPQSESRAYRYPPFDDGLPIVAPDRVLGGQADLLRRIHLGAGLPEPDFRRLVVPVVRNLAEFWQLLPATRKGHHRGAGGAFRLAVETVFWSLQGTEGVVFTGLAPAERKRVLEPRWRYATLLAGACADLYVAATDMVVLDATGAKQWVPFDGTLYAWATRERIDRVYVTWRSVSETAGDVRARQTTSSLLVQQIVPPASLAWIAQVAPEIVETMLAAVAGTAKPGDKNPVADILARARAGLLDLDEVAQPEYQGRQGMGSNPAPYVVDAMRSLIQRNIWRVNERGGRLYHTTDGVFVLWPLAAKDVIRELATSGVSPVPQDEEILARLLLDCDLIEGKRIDGVVSAYWRIQPEGGAEVSVVKLRKPALVFGDQVPGNPCVVQVVSAGGAAAAGVSASPAPGATASAPAAAPAQAGTRPIPVNPPSVAATPAANLSSARTPAPTASPSAAPPAPGAAPAMPPSPPLPPAAAPVVASVPAPPTAIPVATPPVSAADNEPTASAGERPAEAAASPVGSSEAPSGAPSASRAPTPPSIPPGPPTPAGPPAPAPDAAPSAPAAEKEKRKGKTKPPRGSPQPELPLPADAAPGMGEPTVAPEPTSSQVEPEFVASGRSRMQPVTSYLIDALRKDLQAGDLTRESLWGERGYAVSVEAVSGYGVDADAVFGDLLAVGWLVAADAQPGNRRERIKFKAPVPAGAKQCVVFRADVAEWLTGKPRPAAP